ARVERFLHLAAEDNIQVCQPSTAAQYFHLLRRQSRRRWRKPLVVFTPKGMLRAVAAASPVAELAAGRFETVLPDPAIPAATRVLLCTGRVAHDLRAERDRRADTTTAVVRIEQLYPFPRTAIDAILSGLPAAAEIVWVQEEPRNMGALDFVKRQMQG